ncbi:unnamed protein product [Triticum turgidum subsp. durum]|uniref:Uncharacterized protein n=1 Tax=Triticum turgidum subsp. durum TaxID=4567 RepID=A0A9R1PXM5_TRITD|nr:unnamed protein product [Triticum turgidum subsp. durum]
MDAMERGQSSPRLPKSRGSKIDEESLRVPLIESKKTGSRAPAVVLGFECLESTAFNGVATNLVLYLESVLHGSGLASASNVTTWIGTSFLTPVLGAILADTFWGNYTTILVSLVVYLLGMMLITFSALLPTTELCGLGSSCHPMFGAHTVAFSGLYLVAFGSGGVRAALLPFGAEQFDDDNAVDRERKMAFFSWFYICVDFGMIVSGLFLVWIQQNVSWGLGFGIATACIALAFVGFVLFTPMYKRSMPTGSPFKSLCQVVVAACRKVTLRVPADAAVLYEVSDKIDQPRIAHTKEFTFLDKAAVVADSDLEEMPQYFVLAGAEVFCYIAQLEFFYSEAPESMKSMCTSFALLTVALGSYASSLIYAVVNALTATGGRPGWISDDLNEGHLDYFFWTMAALCTLNFVVYSAFARNYQVKTVVS